MGACYLDLPVRDSMEILNLNCPWVPRWPAPTWPTAVWARCWPLLGVDPGQFRFTISTESRRGKSKYPAHMIQETSGDAHPDRLHPCAHAQGAMELNPTIPPDQKWKLLNNSLYQVTPNQGCFGCAMPYPAVVGEPNFAQK